MHQLMAGTMDAVIDVIRDIQEDARENGFTARPRWPMIVLRSPKGWTGPKEVDGVQVEGTFRAHQVPVDHFAETAGALGDPRNWMQSYRPEELFDESGKLIPDIAASGAPRADRRMGANPHANGGLLLRDLDLPDFADYAVDVPAPGTVRAEATRVTGAFLRDVMKLKSARRISASSARMRPHRTVLERVFEVTNRESVAAILPGDDHVSADGRVMEVLSEHMCQGWLEGYLLTGRHGFFSCYEAFIHIIDSMFNQHAKWLKVTRKIPWRRPIASLNYLLTSHVWRQDHNGFSHQDPGFIDHVVNKKADVVRVYLPPDANCLLSVTDHCLRSRNYVNVIVGGQAAGVAVARYGRPRSAIARTGSGSGIGRATIRARNPTSSWLAAATFPPSRHWPPSTWVRKHLPDVRIRVVNVVDLMTLQPSSEHPHGLSDRDFDSLFTTDKPIVFAFHGYPWLIHRLTYRRNNHENLHVRGYKEEGTTTTPFDMTVLNDLDRFHLAMDVIDRVPRLQTIGAHRKQKLRDIARRSQAVDREVRRRYAGNPRLAMAGLMRVLVFNAGSSNLKGALWELDGSAPRPTLHPASGASRCSGAAENRRTQHSIVS